MARFFVRRLLAMIPTLFGVALITFTLLHLTPGDPVALLTSEYQEGISPELLHELRERFGLNDPLYMQFFNYIGNAATGDLGQSIFQHRPVTELVAFNWPHTARLGLASLAVSLSLGIPLGVISAVRRGSWFDNASIGFSLLGLSVPQFWLAMMSVLIFAVHLGWFPASGFSSWKHLVLPAAVLGIRSSVSIARLTRSTMLDVLGEQYVVTARAKGVREFTVINRHALKNAFIPVVTQIGLQLGYLLGGAVVLEVIFNRPGLGYLMYSGISRKDFPIVQGTALVIAVAYVLINILVDLAYTALDPRVRLS